MRYIAPMNFIAEQMDAAGYNWNDPHNFKIRTIVEQFFRDIDTKGLTESEAQELFRIIYMLGSTTSMAPEGHTIKRHMRWIPYREGKDNPGALCRIKFGAFEGPKSALNGKVGTISRFLPNGQVSVYLRTFAANVQVNISDLEVVEKKRF